MFTKKTEEKKTEITVIELEQGEVTIHAVGRTPLIFNRMSEKAKRELLLPSRKKTDADKAATLKHEPVQEYRDSVYRWGGDTPTTRLKIPSGAFKGSLRTAALDLPGTRKTEIGRLVYVMDDYIDFYGVPQLLMSVVRNAGANHAPDIRTRAIVRNWCCSFTVLFVEGKLTIKSISNLAHAAGVLCGVGDWRQEKGSGSHGMFRVCHEDDEEYQRILAEGGREQQDAALDKYTCYDEDTDELLSWYHAEILRRGREKPRKRRGAANDQNKEAA
jgi:hypothetical protein